MYNASSELEQVEVDTMNKTQSKRREVRGTLTSPSEPLQYGTGFHEDAVYGFGWTH